MKTKLGRGPAPRAGANEDDARDSRKMRRARDRGPFYGSAISAALALLIASMTACEAPPPTGKYKGPSSAGVTAEEGGGGPGDSGSGGSDEGDEPCEEDAVRDCQVVLGEHEGVTTCFEGEQRCHEGEWGDCEDPEDDDES